MSKPRNLSWCAGIALALPLLLTGALASRGADTAPPPMGTPTPTPSPTPTNPPLLSSTKTFGPVIVDLADLDVHVSVPIFTKPGRGLSFGYSLEHDNWWDSPSLASPNQGWTTVGQGGWLPWNNVTLQNVGCVNGQWVNQSGDTYTFPVIGLYRDAAGGVHIPPVVILGQCGATAPGTYAFRDGSGLNMIVSAGGNASDLAIQAPDGTIVQPFLVQLDQSGNFLQITGGAVLTDRNGNQISASLANTQFTDTIGTTFQVGGSFWQPQSFSYTDTSGTSRSVSIQTGNYTLQTNFGCAVDPDLPATSASLPQSVTYPDGSSEQFTYESTPGFPSSVTGRIASVKLRTGATISIAYSGVNCGDWNPTELTVTTIDGLWTFERNGPNGASAASTTTVSDPTGNQMVVSFQGLFETQKQIYQGSSTSGTLLETVTTCYNGNTSNCTTTSVSLPITEVSRITSLPNGQVTELKETDTKFNTTGGVTEVDESLWRNGAPGSLGRKTLISYAQLGNGIANKPATVTVCAPSGSDPNCNGSGTQIAQTTFAYDQTGLQPSGATQHVSVSGHRGNLTSAQRWLNPPGSTLSTTLTYDDAGQVLTATDPNGNKASASYGCNDAFATSITLPPTSVAHAVSATYDCNTGPTLSATDQNGNKTSLSYDGVLRSTEVDYPDGGKTTFSYPDTNHVIMQQAIDSSRSISLTTVLDGYGRTQQTQQVTPNCSSGVTTVTNYGPVGLVNWVTNPYCATSDPTYGLTAFEYDALGRTTQVTHPDGSTTQFTYTGRATEAQDEGNGGSRVTRISQTDDFGRLGSVCEVTGTTQAGSNKPSACNQDIAATGFLTTYTYDLLNDVIGVQQSAVSRSFTYDSLSRLLSETHPESGTTSYTYDSNGNLLTRVRPAPNQGNPNTTVTTTYAYDALNRMTQKSYSDGKTPTVNFLYDTAAGWGNPTVTQSNLIGRLSEAYLSGSPQGNTVFGYDPMGRITANNQCTPLNCGTGNWPLGYQYDLLGDVTSATNGVGVTFSYAYDSAARLSSMTSSLSDNNHPGTLYSNLQYNPLGEVTATSLGATLNELFEWDCRGRILGYASAPQPAAPFLSLNNMSGCPNELTMNFKPSPPGHPREVARAVSFSKPYPFGTSVLLTRDQGFRKGERGSITLTLVSFDVNRTSKNITTSYREDDSLLEIAQRLASQINNDKAFRLRATVRKVGSDVRIELTSQDRVLQPDISVLISVSSDQAKPSITATVLPIRRPLVLLGRSALRQMEAK